MTQSSSAIQLPLRLVLALIVFVALPVAIVRFSPGFAVPELAAKFQQGDTSARVLALAFAAVCVVFFVGWVKACRAVAACIAEQKQVDTDQTHAALHTLAAATAARFAVMEMPSGTARSSGRQGNAQAQFEFDLPTVPNAVGSTSAAPPLPATIPHAPVFSPPEMLADAFGAGQRRKNGLLELRAEQMLLALHLGLSPQVVQDGFADALYFAAPDRVLRASMDTALNVGIAGTFAAFILTLTGQTLTTETLLTHLGPGLVSGLSAVAANVCLRLCHTELLEQQDSLTRRVERVLTRHFLACLPRSVADPGERLAFQVRNSVQEVVEVLTDHLAKPMRDVADVATDLRDETRRLAKACGTMAEHSETWTQSVASMKEFVDGLQAGLFCYLMAQTSSSQAHELRLREIHSEHLEMLQSTAAEIEEYRKQLMRDTTEMIGKILEQQKRVVDDTIEAMSTKFQEESTQRADNERRARRALLVEQGKVLLKIANTIKDRIGVLLSDFADGLQDAVKQGSQDAMEQTRNSMEQTRRDMGEIGEHMEQLGQSLVLQIAAYKRWARLMSAKQDALDERYQSLLSGLQQLPMQLSHISTAFREHSAEILAVVPDMRPTPTSSDAPTRDPSETGDNPAQQTQLDPAACVGEVFHAKQT